MCQHDPLIIEEYKNPLIEFTKSFIFVQNGPNFTLQSDFNSTADSVFIQLILYWTGILNDQKNFQFIHTIYLHALNTIKSVYLSSGNENFKFTSFKKKSLQLNN